MIAISDDQSLEGYLDHSLAYFNTSDFQVGSAPRNSSQNVTLCRYVLCHVCFYLQLLTGLKTIPYLDFLKRFKG